MIEHVCDFDQHRRIGVLKLVQFCRKKVCLERPVIIIREVKINVFLQGVPKKERKI